MFLAFPATAQEKARNYTVNGYLQMMNMLWDPPVLDKWQNITTLTNRLDLRWYPSNNLRFHLGMRNISNYGQMVSDYYPLLNEMAKVDQGYLDLTKMIINEKNLFFYATFDRMNFEYTAGNFVATVGRQRINWGVNLVWNPNDIFNAFNYFDFDYMERPGCDAIHLQYYTGTTSSVEIAVKIDQHEQKTYAAMFKFNKWEYDFQFMTGILNDEDFVFGFGWAGQIEGAGFMGEGSYFRNLDNFKSDKGVFVGSLTANYTFKNNLLVQIAVLCNSDGTTKKAGIGDTFMLSREISAKNFTLAKYSLNGTVSYPITPLIKTDFSVVLNPSDKSAYFGPSVDISLTDNIGFLVMGQIFSGKNGTEFGNYGTMVFSRLKWTF